MDIIGKLDVHASGDLSRPEKKIREREHTGK